MRILKQRFEGKDREFLIEWKGFPQEMQTWEKAAQFENEEWQEVYRQFLDRCNTNRNTSNRPTGRSDVSSSSSTQSDGGSTVDDSSDSERSETIGDKEKKKKQIWKVFHGLRVLMKHKNVIQQLGPLSNVHVDYAMEILSSQTQKFQQISCICPITGYPSAINQEDETKGHVSIHHCGESHHHWLVSFLQRASMTTTKKSTVWVTMEFDNHLRMTAKLLTELTDLYFVECPEELINHEINIIPMKSQVKKDTCGYLAIATAVEVMVGGVDLAKLYSVQFDEGKIGEWLLSCMEAQRFTVCPKILKPHQPKHDKNGWNSNGRGFLITEVNMEFIRLQQPTKKFKRMRKKTGSGLSYSKSSVSSGVIHSPMNTAPSQHGRQKLMTGCVIQLHYTLLCSKNRSPSSVGFKWAGDWVVTKIDVRNRAVLVRSVLDDKKESRLHHKFLFRIVSPPCLCVEAFCALKEYELIADKKELTLVYPVSECKLSDTAFATKDITRSVILEILRCKSLQDVQSMLALMSGRTVWLYVQIQELLPYRYLTVHIAALEGAKPRQQANAVDTYHAELDWILGRSKVSLQKPVTGTAWELYDMLSTLIKLGVPANDMIRIPFPLDDDFSGLSKNWPCLPFDAFASTPVSASEKMFPVGTTMEEIMKWSAGKYRRKNVPQEGVVLLRPSVPEPNVVRTTVSNGIVILQEVGHHVSEADTQLLVEAALLVIHKVNTISISEAEHWAAYRFDVALTDDKTWILIRASSWESETLFKNLNERVQVKGVIALGGSKMVLLAHPNENKESTSPVAVYKLRDPTSQPHKQMFHNDISIHKFIEQATKLQPSPLFLKVHHAWNTASEPYLAVEVMKCNVGTVIKLWGLTFGKQTDRQTVKKTSTK
jgi:hypothetical protein